MASNKYPVSKTQSIVLNALGMEATDFEDADAKFREIGITVGSKRVGRSVEPVVMINRVDGGSLNNGDGESWDYVVKSKDVDLTPVKQWMK